MDDGWGCVCGYDAEVVVENVSMAVVEVGNVATMVVVETSRK